MGTCLEDLEFCLQMDPDANTRTTTQHDRGIFRNVTIQNHMLDSIRSEGKIYLIVQLKNHSDPCCETKQRTEANGSIKAHPARQHQIFRIKSDIVG